MRFEKTVLLKNGKEALIRSGNEGDGKAALEVFDITHAETDYLLSYPEESSLNAEQEAQYLKEKMESDREAELIAVIDGRVAGLAGINSVGNKYKVKHRAEFGISILKEYWGIGLGKAMTEACIKCAADAGYDQLELNVVAENYRAMALYHSLGFVEFGRNPVGFNSKISGYQELVYMMLRL